MKSQKIRLIMVCLLLLSALAVTGIVSYSAFSAAPPTAVVSASIDKLSGVTLVSPGPDEILHVITTRMEEKTTNYIETLELWISGAGDSSRAVFTNNLKDKTGEFLVIGDTKYTYTYVGKGIPGITTAYIAPGPEDEQLNTVEDYIYKYARLIEKGKADVISRSEINSRKYLEIDVHPSCCPGDKVVAIIDEATKLPVKETVFQDNEELGAVVSTYEVIEVLKRNNISDNPFKSDITETITSTTEKLNLEKARSFKPYDLYFIGEDFEGLTIRNIQHDVTYPVNPESIVKDIVLISYCKPDSELASGSILETYVTIEKLVDRETETLQNKEPIIKDGLFDRTVQDGVLRKTTRGTYMKEIVRGESLITLWNNTVSGITEMENALQELK